jgi:hypothetical protein
MCVLFVEHNLLQRLTNTLRAAFGLTKPLFFEVLLHLSLDLVTNHVGAKIAQLVPVD